MKFPGFFAVVGNQSDIDAALEKANAAMRDYTMRAARGECEWICSGCGASDVAGMPDACFHGQQECTDIIKRDKARALGSAT